jgi:hypothetical protein
MHDHALPDMLLGTVKPDLTAAILAVPNVNPNG